LQFIAKSAQDNVQVVEQQIGELEAFCEAFELKTDLEKSIKRSRKKFTETEEVQVTLSPVKKTESIEELSIGEMTLREIPIPEFIDKYPMILASAS